MATLSEEYERVATELLNRFCGDFGLSCVEGKQRLSGKRTATQWEIDAKGVLSDGKGFVVVECRRYTTKRLDQESMAALAYRIEDLGAAGGIVISPLELQKGAKLVAASEDIVHMRLDQDSTSTDYLCEFLGRVFVGRSIVASCVAAASFSARVTSTCSSCGLRFEHQGEERQCELCRRM